MHYFSSKVYYVMPTILMSFKRFFHFVITDQTECDRQINQLRSDIKVKVSNLRDKEGQPELRGFDLRALDTQDSEGIKWKQWK